MKDGERRDWARDLVEEAAEFRSSGDLGTSLDLSDVASTVVQDDRSEEGVEIFVRAAIVRARSLRNRDKNFESHLLTGEAVDRARALLREGHPARVQAEAAHLASWEANYERDDSASGLSKALRLATKLEEAYEGAMGSEDAVELALGRAQLARRVGDKEASMAALDTAGGFVPHIVDLDLTARYYLARSLHELAWGSESEGVECLEISDRVSAGIPALEIHNRFGHASLELRFGSPDTGAELLADACKHAEERGFLRSARVGRKDLAHLLLP